MVIDAVVALPEMTHEGSTGVAALGLSFLVSLSVTLSCKSKTEQQESPQAETNTERQALSSQDYLTLGFEDIDGWESAWGDPVAVSAGEVRVEGKYSLALEGNNYSAFRNVVPLSSSMGFSTVGYDLRTPETPPEGWPGDTQLYIHAPNAGINNAYVGIIPLLGWPPGEFQRAEYPLPSQVIDALAGGYDDLQLIIAMNVPANAGTYYLDRVILGNGGCVPQDDGDPCTADICDADDGSTRHEPHSVDDGNPCTEDSCDPTLGSSVHTPRPQGAVCGTGRICDGDGVCLEPECSMGIGCVEPECASDLDCHDGNPCTTETCEGGICAVTSSPVGASCGEGGQCKEDGSCGCTSNEDCEDNNACTTESCQNRACVVNLSPLGKACDIASACDRQGTCSLLRCDEAADCEDGNPCTAKDCQRGACVLENAPQGASCGNSVSCDGNGLCGCQVDADCDDGNACTAESCQTGACQVSLVPQGGSCGQDLACDGKGGCVDACSVDADCIDSNVCTEQSCQNGACIMENKPLGTTCSTNQLCDAAGNCRLSPCATEQDCTDDGNPCTVESCQSGACVRTQEPTGASCGYNETCGPTGTCSARSCESDTDCELDQSICTLDRCEQGVCVVAYAPSDIVCGPAASCDGAGGCTLDTTYTYDPLERLIMVSQRGKVQEGYAYDQAGNRCRVSDAAPERIETLCPAVSANETLSAPWTTDPTSPGRSFQDTDGLFTLVWSLGDWELHPCPNGGGQNQGLSVWHEESDGSSEQIFLDRGARELAFSDLGKGLHRFTLNACTVDWRLEGDPDEEGPGDGQGNPDQEGFEERQCAGGERRPWQNCMNQFKVFNVEVLF